MDSDTIKDSIPAPEQWVDAYSDVLFRYAYIRTGDRSSAEDLVQETFLAALQAYKHFEGRSSLQTWLISILRNKISEYLRACRRQPVKSSDMEPAAEDFFENGKWKVMPAKWSAKPEEEASKKEFWGIFIRCIRRLSPTLADAFILRVMKLMEPNDICNQLNISDTGLWSRLHRARLNLRQCLEKNWFLSD
jgi:RNA polymerase sigma-70 factor (ECF subfamily)